MANENIVKGSELQLGDVVQLNENEYMTATVKQIENGIVTFFRPYVVCQDFSHSGGALLSVGIEEFKRYASENESYQLHRKGDVK